MSGARPLYLSSGFILEEGFAIDDLKKILASMRDAAAEAGVTVVTGDTKVVQKGGADKIFINTSGIGVVESPLNLSHRVRNQETKSFSVAHLAITARRS